MTGLGEAHGPSVVIRKYANRRLYDTSRSRYVTLRDIAYMVGDGADVRVIQAGAGIDITRKVFAQIILEGEISDGLLDESVLRRLIRLRHHPSKGRLSRHIAGSLDSFSATTDERGTPGRETGTQRPEARIVTLQARIERLIAGIRRERASSD